MMSALYIFLLLTLVRGTHTGTTLIQDAINAIQLGQTQKQPCDLSKLPPGYQVIHCTEHRQPCDMKCNITRTNVTTDVCCIDGIWDITNSGTAALQPGHVRHKRFWFLIPALIAAAGLITCIIFCEQNTQEVQHTRKIPTFDKESCPPPTIQQLYITDINKKKHKIDWNKPTAKDADLKEISDIRIVAGLDTGSEFPEGLHYITYLAQDEEGYQAFCSFSFTVQVVRCDPAVWPRHGYMKCTSTDPIYGTSCSTECEEGFERSGDSKSECTKSGAWTSDTSRPCSKIKCPKPSDPLNGKYACSTPGNEQEYQSICWPECNDGYGLEKMTYSHCSANKTWSANRQPVCKDIEPPKIECAESYHHFYADSGNVKKNAVWLLPKAVDTVDGNNTRIVKISGLDVGSDLPVGFTTVQYRAVDNTQNESPICTTILYVEEIVCPHPSLQIIDENIRFSCRNLNLGQNCTLSCRFNLPLVGDLKITCSADGGASVGKWTWSNGTQPYCEDIKCSALPAPVNGAMTCDSINARPFCSMSCNTDFDIPYRFDGRYFCLDSGRWDPNNAVPNCTVPSRPHFWNLPATLSYFSGSCNEENVLREIKKNFLKIIAKLPQQFRTNCTIDNIKVTCGAVQPRSRRTVLVDVSDKSLNGHRPVGIPSNIRHKRQSNNTYNNVIEFDILVPWNQGNMSLADAYTYHDNMTFTFRDKLIDLVNAGEFDLPGYSRPSYHFDDVGMFHCENGFLDNNVCKMCRAGQQYNKDIDTCEDCPLNKYQDKEGITPCKVCPPHHVTLETGRKHVNECTELCPAGTYSNTSVVPCTPCPIGSYQSSIGQKACISCPEGKITNSSGRTTDADCAKYDIYINRELSNLQLKSLDVDAFDLTLALWLRVSTTNNGPPNISLSSYHPNHGEYFFIAIKDTISVRIKQALHMSSETVPLGKWVLLVVILDSDSQVLTIKLKDKTVLQESFFSDVNTTVLMSGSSIRMTVGSNTTIRFTGLFLSSQNLSESRIQSLSSSCSYDIPPSPLSMSDISRLRQTGIQVEIPSSCDAVDECKSKPCGNHTCINIRAGFECSCLHGYSGSTCAIPPDLCRNNDCKNGATCINNGLDYKCKCPPSYSGDLCQEAPIDGNWSYWSTWSLCSQTCGGGSRSRSRQCNSPAPGDYGLNCTGHDHETDNCNIEDCPSCPELPLGNGTKVNITFVNGTEIRKISCQDGLAFAPGFEPDQEYKCGISTNYNWAHTSTANPLGRPPSCGEISGPQKLATTTTILYDTLPCSASSVAKATIEDKRMSMQCVSNNTCNASVSTTCSGNGTVVAMITLSASLEGKENLDVQTFYESNTVSDNLHALVNTVIELETSTQKLVNESAHRFEVQDGGKIHRVNTRSIDAVGSVVCPVGSVSSGGVCVECPVGTYYQSSTSSCQYCEIGAYQDETAQSVCKPCLLGYTTVGVGSVSIQDCKAKPARTSTIQSDVYENSRMKPDDAETNLALIIGCSLAGVVVTSVLIGIIIYKWKTRTNPKGSFLSLRKAISPAPETCVSHQSPFFENVKIIHFQPQGRF
ncbi:hypothetical protein ACJMK2_038974 [Sinanodonta woodiana]|uniref:Sushi, von Willebrand factor type A, EGF and pentraxin domain-containing protein 1 n=1 Tax=Sinanodonta woodiana TaxID=1069815 RepID=A0ABD3WAK8_SINWO